MRSVQSLVISASMKQIVPLIAVKMWCWNPLRFYEGSSHLHGFILRYSQAVHTRWEIIIKKKTHLHLFPIWFGAGIKKKKKKGKNFQDAIVFSWTVNCGKAGNETSLFDLKLVFLCVSNRYIRRQQNRWYDLAGYFVGQVKIPAAILPLKWPRFGTKTPLLCRISDRTLSITSE